jgi:hypothetical protein
VKFIVDRSNWFRGQGNDKSRLLRKDGGRCCIGFVGQQCQVSDGDMLDVAEALQIDSAASIRKFPAWMQSTTSGDLSKAYAINDEVIEHDNEGEVLGECEVQSESDREKQLQSLFAENGDEIEFIN